MFPEPPLALGMVGDDPFQALPKCRAVAALQQVHQLVSHDVPDHPLGQHGHAPVKIDVSSPPAGAPAVAKILNVDLLRLHADTMGKGSDLPIQDGPKMDGVPMNKVLPCLRHGIAAELETALVQAEWRLA